MKDPDAVKRLLPAERTCDMYGSVGIVVLNYGEMLKALLNIVVSVGLSLQLVLTRPAADIVIPLSRQEDEIGRAAALLSVPGVSLLLFGAALAGMAFLSCLLYTSRCV